MRALSGGHQQERRGRGSGWVRERECQRAVRRQQQCSRKPIWLLVAGRTASPLAGRPKAAHSPLRRSLQLSPNAAEENEGLRAKVTGSVVVCPCQCSASASASTSAVPVPEPAAKAPVNFEACPQYDERISISCHGRPAAGTEQRDFIILLRDAVVKVVLRNYSQTAASSDRGICFVWPACRVPVRMGQPPPSKPVSLLKVTPAH